MEGMRWRDELSRFDEDLIPTFSPCGRFRGRQSEPRRQGLRTPIVASRMVANIFDDDLDPANGDTMNYGAGPVVQFQGGNPTLPTASQQLIVPATPVYKPKRSDGTPGLELNTRTKRKETRSTVTWWQEPSISNPAYDQQSPTPSADEDNNYNRRDFMPHDPAAGSTPDPAFLVRMRRTPLWNVPNSLDNTPGISSAGPTLPVLFGRGSLMAQTGSGPVERGVRHHGSRCGHRGDSTGPDGRTAHPPASIPGSLSAKLQIPLADGTTRDQLYYIVFNLSQWNSPNSSQATGCNISRWNG